MNANGGVIGEEWADTIPTAPDWSTVSFGDNNWTKITPSTTTWLRQ